MKAFQAWLQKLQNRQEKPSITMAANLNLQFRELELCGNVPNIWNMMFHFSLKLMISFAYQKNLVLKLNQIEHPCPFSLVLYYFPLKNCKTTKQNFKEDSRRHYFFIFLFFIYQKQTNVLIDNKNMRRMKSPPHDVQTWSKETK